MAFLPIHQNQIFTHTTTKNPKISNEKPQSSNNTLVNNNSSPDVFLSIITASLQLSTDSNTIYYNKETIFDPTKHQSIKILKPL